MIYKIQPALINKVVGYSASRKMLDGYNYGAANSVYKIAGKGKINFIPNLDAIEIEKRGKLMDIISSVPLIDRGITISDRLLNIIKMYSLPSELQIFDAYAIHKDIKKHYNYFHIYHSYEDKIIDWNKSKFIGRSDDIKNPKNIYTLDINELIDLFNNNKRITPHEAYKLVINQSEIKTDIFKLHFSNRGYYVSEELKNAIENSDCQGVDLIPIDQLRFEVEFQ